MPKAAKPTSSRGGRTSIDLVMVELTTRQTRQSGSSTQNPSIVSSTQKIQNQTSIEKISIEASKQTRADYVILIKTLLAFQEQGLVSLPDKTWLDIADEEEEQMSLNLIIKNLKSKTLQVNPRTQTNQIQEGTSHPQFHNNQTTQFQYTPKSKFLPIIQMEHELWDKNPNKVYSKIFPPGLHHQPIAFNKTTIL
jgi:hypothetical protein